MKKIFFFLSLLLLPIPVFASDYTIDSLAILNGELSPTFNKYNNQYTIILDRDEDEVLFDYTVDESITVAILNNTNVKNNTMVTMDLLVDNEIVATYSFSIYKEEEQSVFNEIKEETVEQQDFIRQYKQFIIPITCLILVILSHKIIFYRPKKKKS